MINQNNWWEKSNSIKYWYIEYVIVLDYINKTKNANMLLRIYNFTLILSKLQIKSVIYSTCNLKIIYVKKTKESYTDLRLINWREQGEWV